MEFYSRFTNIFLLLIVFLLIVFYKRGINRIALAITSITFFLEILTWLSKGLPDIGSCISCIVNIFLTLLVVSAIDWKMFKKCFSDINFFICIFSLICLLLYTINLPIYNHFPLLFNSHGDGGYYAILATPRIEFSAWSSYRIQGIYWEPGAFQFFIIVSALIDIYNKDLSRRYTFTRISVYIISLIFTFSTTGIICGFIMTVLYLYNIRDISKIPLIVFSLIVICIVSYGVIEEDSFLYYSIFGKIEHLSNSYSYGGSNDVSADVRVNSFISVFNEFIKTPIVGLGESGNALLAERGVTMMTFTPLNLFAFYGIIMGFIHFIGLIKIMDLSNKHLIEAIIVFVVLILSTSSEQFAFNPIIMCFCMYGYMGIHHDNIVFRKLNINNNIRDIQYVIEGNNY